MLRFYVEIAVFSLLLTGLSFGQTPQPDSRYGFGLLDRRSIYGAYFFPEPLNADEADVDNEVRADWLHTEKTGHQADEVRVELEKSFGSLTLEVAPTYESDRVSFFNPDSDMTEQQSEEGLGNVELGARHPIYQYVSPGGFFDTTFVLGLEVAVPTLSEISRDVEVVPKLFNLTRVGEHFSIQTGLGNSILVGPDGRGLSTIEYSAVFGYELATDQLPMPGALSITPLFELEGEYTMNQEDAGHNELSGTVGFRINCESIGALQPRIGLGYVFPIDAGAREDFDWGIVTSLVLEY